MKNTKKVTVEFEICTEQIGNETLEKIVEQAIINISPTLITKIDVRVYYNYHERQKNNQ